MLLRTNHSIDIIIKKGKKALFGKAVSKWCEMGSLGIILSNYFNNVLSLKRKLTQK